jgi:hypothetical protein
MSVMTDIEVSNEMLATRKIAAIKIQALLYDAVSHQAQYGSPIVTRDRANEIVDAIALHILTVIRDGFGE